MNYIELNEADLRKFLITKDLNDPDRLNAVCKLVDIHLTTAQYTQGIDKWTASPNGGGLFIGTLKEVAAYVTGYAFAWEKMRRLQREALKEIMLDINDRLIEL